MATGCRECLAPAPACQQPWREKEPEKTDAAEVATVEGSELASVEA